MKSIIALYRGLLRFYPVTFYEAYGPQMIQTLKDWCADTPSEQRFSVWVRAFGDLLFNLPLAWFEYVTQGEQPMTQPVSAAPVALSFVLPIYNEERRIASLIQKVAALVSQFTESWELIIVDDQSEDASVKTVEALANDHVKMLRLTQNKGIEEAIRQGIRYAESTDIIVLSAAIEDEPRDLKIALNSPPVLIREQQGWSGGHFIQTLRRRWRHGWRSPRKAYRIQRVMEM